MNVKVSPVLICIAAAVIVMIGLLTLLFQFPVLSPSDWDWFSFLRIAGAFALTATSLHLFSHGCARFVQQASTTWWDPAATPDGKLTWQQVCSLTLDDAFDPLEIERRPRWRQITREVFAAILITGALASMVISAAKLFGSPTAEIATIFDAASSKGSASLTVFLALLTAALTLFFTFYQLKAKVRADNRQAWIAKLRTLIAEVVSLSNERAGLGRNDRERWHEIWRELSPKRLELELLLNPSEKDHRLLMYLSQLLALGNISHIQDANNLRASVARELKCEVGNIPEPWKDLLTDTTQWKLVGRTMRLSHVVLKREWERVKSAR